MGRASRGRRGGLGPGGGDRDYRFGRAGIDAVLAGIAGQTEETSALLSCVTDYNAAIAEYSLTVLPGEC